MDEAPLLDIEGHFGPSRRVAATALVARFEAQGLKELSMLRLAIDHDAHEEAARAAHSLAGSAFAVGAQRLGQCASDVEARLKRREPVDADAIIALFHETVEAIGQWRASRR